MCESTLFPTIGFIVDDRRKKMWRRAVSWGPNQETVRYYNYETYRRDPDRTVGHPSDRITTVNVPAYVWPMS